MSGTPFIDSQGDKTTIGARGEIDGNANTVSLNPTFNSKSLSAADVTTHEIGFHNMQRKAHVADSNGDSIYPASGLESNRLGRITPNTSDTKQIIDENLKIGRMVEGNGTP